jgi:ABC-type nitrate/sulfonate/bicarbonate transport system permease component
MAVVAEMIGSPNGIGYAIIREQQAMKPTNMFAYIFTIALINVFINYLLSKMVNQLSPGKSSSRLNQKGLAQ